MWRSASGVVRTSLPTSPRSQLAQYGVGGRGQVLGRLLETGRDGRVESLTFLGIELVAFVVGDQIQDSTLGKVGGLIHDEPTASYWGTHTHES
jgi:hypothetical protein